MRARLSGTLLTLTLLSCGLPSLPSHISTKPVVRDGVGERSAAVQLRYANEGTYYAQQYIAQLNNTIATKDATINELNNKIDTLTTYTAGVGSGSVATATRTYPSVGDNHFPWGWCTWYVASRRYVPWLGDAGTWLYGAVAFGFAIGRTPRVGAIMVSAESRVGHVAYVESVGVGSFVVTEMNFAAWGYVDVRTVVIGTVPILGFIY